MTANHTLLQVTIEQATLDLIIEIKNLLSHEIPDGHLNKVLKRMAEISAEQLKKKKGRGVCDEAVTSRAKGNKGTVRNESIKSEMSLVIEKPFLRDNNRQDESYRSSKRRAIKSRHIPIEIRRKVFQRAHGCCEYVSSEGKRCQSHYQLEVDHVVSWSHGGEHSLENCSVLCRNHNQYRVKETHGYWYSQKGLLQKYQTKNTDR